VRTATRPTTWVWEAVAVYLPRQAVDDTLAAVASRSAPGSHLAMTFVVPELLPGSGPLRSVTPLVRAAFARLGEPLHTTLSDDEVAALLRSAGFEPQRITGVEEWSAGSPIRARPDLFAAERLVTATTR